MSSFALQATEIQGRRMMWEEIICCGSYELNHLNTENCQGQTKEILSAECRETALEQAAW